jgi:Asp-tRNA(Asn)/Glu-tRNA(Gln) amidotransferase A subunit family amidase
VTAEGLPSRLQIVTNRYKDELALSIGRALETAMLFEQQALRTRRQP